MIPQCIFQDDKIDIFITLLPMSLFCYFWNLQQQQRKVMMLIRSRNYFKYIINARCSIRYNIIYLFYRWSSTQSSPFAVFVLYVGVSLRCAADSFGGNIIPFSAGFILQLSLSQSLRHYTHMLDSGKRV
jgi:hypothetical protein